MTPEEAEILTAISKQSLQQLTLVVLNSVLFGLYLAVFVSGSRLLLRRQPRTRYSWTLLALICFICALTAANFGVLVAEGVILTRVGVLSNAQESLLNRADAAWEQFSRLESYSTWFTDALTGIQLFIGDAVVVWRACAIYPENRIVRFGLIILLCMGLALSITSDVLINVVLLHGGYLSESSPAGVTIITTASLSLFTNFVSTLLIGYKAYEHREMVKATIGLSRSKTSTVLLFMTETGVVYCVFQAICLALDLSDDVSESSIDWAALVWQILQFFASAVYPILVILIVEHKRSVSDYTVRMSADSLQFVDDKNLRDMIFAPATLNSHGSAMAGNSTDLDRDLEANTASSRRSSDVEKIHDFMEKREDVVRESSSGSSEDLDSNS